MHLNHQMNKLFFSHNFQELHHSQIHFRTLPSQHLQSLLHDYHPWQRLTFLEYTPILLLALDIIRYRLHSYKPSKPFSFDFY